MDDGGYKKRRASKSSPDYGKMASEDGVESVVMNYYRHIDKSKIQFDFICDEDSTNIPYEEIERLGGKVIIVPPYQKIISYEKQMKKVLMEGEYQIVHSHINTLSFFPLLAAKRAGVSVRIAHSHSTSNPKEWKKNLMKNVLRPLSKVYATNYMACSEVAGRYLFGDKTYREGKVFLLNNAIEVEKFQFNEEIRKIKRKELGITEDAFVVGHVGRFVTQKNHSFLLDVFYEMQKEKPKAVLMLVGQGPLLESMKEKALHLGIQDKVLFLGQRNDVEKLYQVMDVFCLPSLYEGLPVVGVEAQASGALCVLSDDMTKETKVLDTTEFLPLKRGAIEWKKTIIRDSNHFQRKDVGFEFIHQGFDIHQEAKKIELKYDTYLSKEGG